jgi:hypothetical protein
MVDRGQVYFESVTSVQLNEDFVGALLQDEDLVHLLFSIGKLLQQRRQ